MEAGYVVLMTAPVVSGLILVASHAARKSVSRRLAEENERRRVDEAFEVHATAGWPYRCKVSWNGIEGLLLMDRSATQLRLFRWGWTADVPEALVDRLFPIRSVRAIGIFQPIEQKTFTYVDAVPMAVARSAMGRALLGGAVAGNAGAQIGALSAVNGRVEYHGALRDQIVDHRLPPRLVIETDSIGEPRIELEFEGYDLVNEWHSRLSLVLARRDRARPGASPQTTAPYAHE